MNQSLWEELGGQVILSTGPSWGSGADFLPEAEAERVLQVPGALANAVVHSYFLVPPGNKKEHHMFGPESPRIRQSRTSLRNLGSSLRASNAEHDVRVSADRADVYSDGGAGTGAGKPTPSPGRKSRALRMSRSKLTIEQLSESSSKLGDQNSMQYESPPLSPSRQTGSPRMYMIPVGGARPALTFLQYRKNWAQDVFTVYHNALKACFIDLYDVIDWLEFYRGTEPLRLFSRFFEWFDVIARFIHAVFAMEESVLYPWIQDRIDPPEQLSESARMVRKRQTTEGIVKLRSLRASQTSPDVLFFIRQEADRIVQNTLSYLQLELRLFVAPIANYFYQKEKDELDKNVAKFMMKSGSHNIIILSNWIKLTFNQKVLNEWKYECIGPQKFPQYAIAEKAYGKYSQYVGKARQKQPPA